MKAWLEEYGRFTVAVLIGLVLLGILFATTVQNTKLMSRLIPDERNMSLSFLKNTEVADSGKIPRMDIVDSVVVLINQNQRVEVDYMSPTIAKEINDGEGNPVTKATYLPMKYARKLGVLKPDTLYIIGTDAVNPQVKGDYKITYFYENGHTGYKNIHDLTVCVRRPYIPLEYIRSTGTQRIETGVVPWSTNTVLTIDYKPNTVNGRQDIVWTGGNRMKYGIFISNGKWGYAYGNAEYVTNISATTGRQSVTLDPVNRTFTVGTTAINITPITENAGNGYINIFNNNIAGTLYSCQIYEGETVKRNFFPAYAKTINEIGLWDTVTWTAYPNVGAPYPVFETGPEIDE